MRRGVRQPDRWIQEDATLNDAPREPEADANAVQRSGPAAESRARRAQSLEALLDLAYDVSSYLRRHAKPGVRVAAALLLAGTLAACSGSPTGLFGSSSIVQPLQQEVRQGLPTTPGRYAIVDGTLGRDGQGVYHFAWRRPTDPVTVRNIASVSRIRLGQANAVALEIPASGDPILYLRSDSAIPLVAANELNTSSGYYSGYHSYWRPFSSSNYRGVGYYDPPSRTYSGGDISGSRMSSSPRTFAERTVGLARAVSGRAGGTGSGTAATAKSGASFATSSSHGGAAAAKSSAFSSGRGGSFGRSSS